MIFLYKDFEEVWSKTIEEHSEICPGRDMDIKKISEIVFYKSRTLDLKSKEMRKLLASTFAASGGAAGRGSKKKRPPEHYRRLVEIRKANREKRNKSPE